MNGRARDLVGEHCHDVLRLDPDVGDEPRNDARRFIGGRSLVEQLAQTDPILFAQSAAHFADGFEAVRLFIVGGGQQSPDSQPRPHPAPPQVADYRHVNRVAQLASVGAFELDPVEVSRPGLVARVEALSDDAFQPALDLLVEEFLKLGGVFGYYALDQADAPGRFGGFGRFGLGGWLDEFLEGGAPRSILLIDVILSVGVEQVEGHKDKRELARPLFDLILALPLRGYVKRMELAGSLVDGDGLAFDYHASSPEARHGRLGDVGEHVGRAFKVARENLHFAPPEMNLAAESVELRLDRAAPEPFDDGFGVRQSLRQHHADRRADMRLELLEAPQAALAHGLERQAEVRAEVVSPLYHGPLLPAVRLQPA